MPDSKITALTSISTSTDPANDPLVIVDVSDTSMALSGTTKKVTLNQLLGASGTATLASATITGDLTVATDRLKVVTGSTAIQTGATTQLQVGTTSWPSSVIGKSGSRSLFGNAGEVIIWNEAAAAIGNYSTLFVAAKTGAGATTLGGLQIRAGIENASNSDGFVSLWTSNSAAGGFVERYKIDSTGIATWSNVGGVAGTAMTLNATGLGVGGPPAAGMLLTVGATSSVSATANALQVLSSKGTFNVVTDGSTNAAGTTITYSWANGGQGPLIFRNASISNVMTLDASGNVGIGVASPAFKLDVAGSAGSGIRFTGNSVQNVIGETGGNGLVGTVSNHNLGFYTNATLRALIDTSGNVGIGVTPSAWGSNSKALQVGSGSGAVSSTGAGTTSTRFTHGCYFDNTNWKYQFTNVGPSLYELTGANAGSTHAWYVSAGGTAGNNITFTQAMTLDASGNLLVGKTATNYLTVGCEVKPNGAFQSTQSGSTNANTCWDTYSTGAGAYRFYVGMAGTVFATNTTISAISDARLKENVQDIDVGLGAILALKPRKFDWKAGKGKDIKGDRGFIAQEFEQVFPQLVDEWADPAPEGEDPYKSVRQDLIPVLVKAIQELTARVQTLETR